VPVEGPPGPDLVLVQAGLALSLLQAFLASLMGITGTRDGVSSQDAGLVAWVREQIALPVAAGVIVGSAFVCA
jgi:tryptophan synthase alpha subunit